MFFFFFLSKLQITVQTVLKLWFHKRNCIWLKRKHTVSQKPTRISNILTNVVFIIPADLIIWWNNLAVCLQATLSEKKELYHCTTGKSSKSNFKFESVTASSQAYLSHHNHEVNAPHQFLPKSLHISTAIMHEFPVICISIQHLFSWTQSRCQSTGPGGLALICVILLYLCSFLHIFSILSTSELHQTLTWPAFQSSDRPILQCDIMENSIPQGSTWLKQALMLIGGARWLRWPFRSEYCVAQVCSCVYVCVFRARK